MLKNFMINLADQKFSALKKNLKQYSPAMIIRFVKTDFCVQRQDMQIKMDRERGNSNFCWSGLKWSSVPTTIFLNAHPTLEVLEFHKTLGAQMTVTFQNRSSHWKTTFFSKRNFIDWSGIVSRQRFFLAYCASAAWIIFVPDFFLNFILIINYFVSEKAREIALIVGFVLVWKGRLVGWTMKANKIAFQVGDF